MRDSFLGIEELGRGDTWRSAAAEFIATFLFIFIGAGAVVSLGIFSSEGGGALGGNLVAIAMAHGLAIAILVSATANLSGGHINPAVSVAAALTRKISPTRGGLYVIAQVVGAILGALLLKTVIPDSLEGGLGSHAIMSDMGAMGGLIVEVVLTFVLVFVIFATAVDPKGPKHLAPFAIGGAVLVIHLVAVPLTGASVNPARTIGPALAAGQWADHWVYWAGPLLGGGIAGVLYQLVFMQEEENY